jgi:adenine-specific DNA-methyltransferase
MFYPVLFKNGTFSTVSDDELKQIYDNNMFNDVFVDSLTSKYTQLGYKVVWPKTEEGVYGRWRWGKDTFFQQKDINLEFNNAGTLCTKMRATLEDGSVRMKSAKTLWYKPEYDTGSSAKLLKSLFVSTDIFDNPKSLIYIQDILKIATNNDSLILDFFSGSATTAHAVMKLNAEDGGNRKFIMVQLPEKTDEKSEAYKADYKNICEIGKERIRRAGKQIKEEAGLSAQNLDTGFRVLKLDTSNMEDVYYTPQEFELQSLFNENVKADRTNEDLLFQVMLDLGIELSAKIECEQIASKNVHFVDDNYLVACFDRDVNESTITEIAKLQPIYFVMRDASAANDNVIDNFEQIFKHYSPDTNCRII